MDLASKETIQRLCSQNHIYPSKERGQNFLVDRDVLNKIIESADLKKDDVILEIGPGFGVLTLELAKRVKKVVAVEVDKRLAGALREILKGCENVEIIESDILKLQITNYKLQNYGYKIVANLPYQITSAVFRKFLENEPRPSEMVVMVQKEVAERICAKPGEMSLLSVSVQFFSKPEIVQVVPRRAFWPEPEVDSAILKISQIQCITDANMGSVAAAFRLRNRSIKQSGNKDRKLTSGAMDSLLEFFFRIVKIGFSARRKQLHNNLSAGLHLPDKEVREILIKLGFDPRVRAQGLSMEDWVNLAGYLRKNA